MSGYFKVSSQELRQKAANLEQLNGNFRKRVEELAASEQNLSTMWEGEAQKAFRTAFNNDRQKFTAFAEGIARYVQALIAAAEKYEQAEAKNVTTASTRK